MIASYCPSLSLLIRVGTLSKAFGSLGGFVTGKAELVEWIINSARTYIYSTAQPETIAAASLAALQIVRDEPERRQGLCKMADKLRTQLTEVGLNIGESESHIIPIIIGPTEKAVQLSTRLRNAGLWVPAIRPPTVADGQSRLRISLSASHTPDHIDRLCHELEQGMESFS